MLLGLAMLSGYELNFAAPKLGKGGGDRSLRSMFTFGLSYAIASLGCTIGPFLGTVGLSTTSTESLARQAGNFVAYGVGMGAVVVALTIAAAVAKTQLATGLRKLLPYINRVSGAFLLIAGAYVAAYGWFEWRVARNNLTKNWFDERGSEIQVDWQEWIANTGQTRLGWVALFVVSAAWLYAVRAAYGSKSEKPSVANGLRIGVGLLDGVVRSD